MNKNSITYLFEDVNLYENKTFTLYTKQNENYSIIEDGNLESFLDYIGLCNRSNLITDCIWCEGHFPFSFTIRVMDYDDQIYTVDLGKNSSGNQELLCFDNPHYIRNPILTKSIETKLITIDYYFSCTNKKEIHHYFMKLAVLFDKEKVIVTKIGQFPENTSIGHFTSEDYKKVLRKLNDSYIDYKNSEKSYNPCLYDFSEFL